MTAQPNEELKPFEVKGDRSIGFGVVCSSDTYLGVMPCDLGWWPASRENEAKLRCVQANKIFNAGRRSQSAPQRKREWKADDVVGEINTDDHALGGCGCGCVPRNIDVKLNNLSPEVQDELNRRKA